MEELVSLCFWIYNCVAKRHAVQSLVEEQLAKDRLTGLAESFSFYFSHVDMLRGPIRI